VKLLQLTGPGQFEIKNVPDPRPGRGEVLMRVDAVTTCPQWDLHLWHDEPMFPGKDLVFPYTPGQPGHEAAGTIAAVGDGVSDFSPGDRVCTWRDPGHTVQGCYAQYVVRRADDIMHAPRDVPDAALAPFELAMCVGTVFRMLRDMYAVGGRRFGVMGLGPAGLIAVQMARAEGAGEVIGFDLDAERRARALRLGASACHDPGEEEWRSRAERLESAVDCVGAASTVEFLLDHTNDAVALFGVQREDYAFRPRHTRVRLCGYQGHSRESAAYAMDLIENGRVDLAPLVTHRMPLEAYGEAVALLEARKALKVCFLPWGSGDAGASQGAGAGTETLGGPSGTCRG
jgi:threonine dehydrogenase-like Zn-dependent dehydrogenase